MQKTGFTSIQVSDNNSYYLEDITSLTVSNYGNTQLTVVVNDVPRQVLPFNPEIGVPFGSFNIPGDGTMSDLKVELRFDGGIGNAIVDYRKLIKC